MTARRQITRRPPRTAVAVPGSATAGQVCILNQAGIAAEQIFVDEKSGATTGRPGLRAALAHARQGDVLVVHTLDRLGRTVRDTLNLIHDLSARGVGVKNLADPIEVDSSNPSDPMAQLSVVLLAVFAQMERTCTTERAAHARAVATAKGRRVGRPVLADPDELGSDAYEDVRASLAARLDEHEAHRDLARSVVRGTSA